jgi:hypothetical protein
MIDENVTGELGAGFLREEIEVTLRGMRAVA